MRDSGYQAGVLMEKATEERSGPKPGRKEAPMKKSTKPARPTDAEVRARDAQVVALVAGVENGTFEDLIAAAATRTLCGARDFLAGNGLKDRKTLRDRKALRAMTIKLSPAEYWALVAIGRKAGINGSGVVGEILRGEREGFGAKAVSA
jgi:hypothetical protein